MQYAFLFFIKYFFVPFLLSVSMGADNDSWEIRADPSSAICKLPCSVFWMQPAAMELPKQSQTCSETGY